MPPTADSLSGVLQQFLILLVNLLSHGMAAITASDSPAS